MDDLQKLERDLKRMEKFPTTYLTGAVKKGIKPILLATQMNAPIGETGNLVRALTTIMEKSKTKGKRVAEVTFDRAYNDRLAKVSKGGKRSYYPSSQEFGFKLRNGKKKEGLHFMRDAADMNAEKFGEIVTSEMMKKIEKAWRG